MLVYSKKIVQFIHEIKSTIKVILAKEIRLKVAGDRFYDRKQRASYPIIAVVFNNKSMLGYFNPHFYELGFHERLMHTSKEQLHNIIRHELAHYIAFIQHGEGIQPHGPEFKAFCNQMGWNEEVYRASTCLESENPLPSTEQSTIFRKVQKLMALATSSNSNEAEQAMIKSQQLLLKHNVESKYFEGEEEEKLFLKRILKQKKENAKMRAIGIILETFFVSTVYRRAEDGIYLEILGSSVNVEIAEYVADFLQNELETLWEQAKARANLKGTIAKNSFFLGLAKGYCNKIHALKREYHDAMTSALMVIEKKLTDAKALVYQRLSSSRSSAHSCKASSALGEQMGKQLSINPGIHKSNSTMHYLE